MKHVGAKQSLRKAESLLEKSYLRDAEKVE